MKIATIISIMSTDTEFSESTVSELREQLEFGVKIDTPNFRFAGNQLAASYSLDENQDETLDINDEQFWARLTELIADKLDVHKETYTHELDPLAHDACLALAAQEKIIANKMIAIEGAVPTEVVDEDGVYYSEFKKDDIVKCSMNITPVALVKLDGEKMFFTKCPSAHIAKLVASDYEELKGSHVEFEDVRMLFYLCALIYDTLDCDLAAVVPIQDDLLTICIYTNMTFQ